jgi:hypothetical protein
MKKILFILKYRDNNNGPYSHGGGLSSGLYNSASMITEMLEIHGLDGKHCESKLIQVKDNNDIDREVNSFKPDLVVIEAVWVVPEKFEILTKLHPKVKWLIRGHSNMPFLAGEGNALDWLSRYVAIKNVYIATNTRSSLEDLTDIVLENYTDRQDRKVEQKILYFPNYYIAENFVGELPHRQVEHSFFGNVLHFLGIHCAKIIEHNHRDPKKEINVGCFGAIRLLKNQLVQATAAVRYAKKNDIHVYFHINSGRVEGDGGNPSIKNIRAVFKNSQHATLIEHEWMPHVEFIQLMDKMDISLQVSFSETFNIVSADAVSVGVPVVVSKEIDWVSSRYYADPTNVNDIVYKMEVAIKDSREGRHNVNQTGLNAYNKRSYIAVCDAINSILEHREHRL